MDSPVAIITAGAGPGIGHGVTEMLCSARSVLVVDLSEERVAERSRGLQKWSHSSYRQQIALAQVSPAI